MVLPVAAPPTLIARETSATPARSADGARRDVSLRRNAGGLTRTISINQGSTTVRTARTLVASLAALLVTAALAVGAAAADSGKANVNVSPADTGHTTVPDDQRYITASNSLTPSQLTAAFATAVGQEQPNVNIPLPAYVPLPASFAETETHPAKANVYVPPAAAFADTVVPATAHANPQPAQRQPRNTSQDTSGFDWASAGIGAAATGGLMLIVVGGLGAVHRARIRPAR